LSATLGGYQRRQDDWTHHADLATKELAPVQKQIAAAQVRVAIAEHELKSHDLQIENAREVDAYLQDRKFTNQELYSWMIGKLSSVYFQGYQLAYDVAKRAERTFRYELGLADSNFIQFGYWDSLKKGLLCGERLHHDLKRMEVAYLDQNRREYEIIKHVSLQAIDPIGLLKLKETGDCFINLPEALFDLDHPGHYMRRLKSVSITIPCVTGPYASVNCTLTQLQSSIRHANTLARNKYARQGDNDNRFSDTFGAIQSIVTSGGQNDSGLFESNLRDERYLPFEGHGAIGRWRIQLPTQFKTFDHDTTSDVILHLRYTAREGGELLRQQASTELAAALDEFAHSDGSQGLVQAFSLRHEFPTEWHRFLNPDAGADLDQTLTLPRTRERFSFLFQDRIDTIDTIELFVKVRPGFVEIYNDSMLKLSLAPGSEASSSALELETSAGLLHATKSPAGPLSDWTLTAWLDGNPHMRLDPDSIQDVLLVCRYTCS
jgi:Tc toxin complex TcA C-terminal TcB-binding domain